MLAVTHLKAGYAGRTVISIPQLTITQGQKTLLLGFSGSGKTTCLLAFAGLAETQTGEVHLKGQNLYALCPSERDLFRGRHIGFMFQALHLVRCLSVKENILLPAFAARLDVDQDYVVSLLDRLGIADLMDKPVTDISQGQAQRVAFARALVTSPSLVLADEPTSSLDDASAQKVIDLFTALTAETHATLIVASHDQRIAKAFDVVLDVEGFHE
ncbi:MAG: ATP-binding cassette domain-containing protein [Pseudobdellovibrionaceae bacterium]